MGTASAYFLSNNPDFDGTVLVVERDPSYARSGTALTHSCIRQQFSTAANIRLSIFTAKYLEALYQNESAFAAPGRSPIDNFGYLFLANSDQQLETLQQAYKLQHQCGVPTQLLEGAAIRRRFPYLATDDVRAASFNTQGEGYWDSAAVYAYWRKAALKRRTEYIANELIAIDAESARRRIAGIRLQTGQTIACDWLINAAGTRAADVAALAAIELPVEPRKRFSYLVRAARPLPGRVPLIVDTSGVHVRAEGDQYLVGAAPFADIAVRPDDFADQPELWDTFVWPALARRIPQFDALRVTHSYVAHYAYNPIDRNAIVGPANEYRNFLFANGFSGHGIQHSPAIGCGLAEWIAYGEFRSIDLAAFKFDRLTGSAVTAERALI